MRGADDKTGYIMRRPHRDRDLHGETCYVLETG